MSSSAKNTVFEGDIAGTKGGLLDLADASLEEESEVDDVPKGNSRGRGPGSPPNFGSLGDDEVCVCACDMCVCACASCVCVCVCVMCVCVRVRVWSRRAKRRQRSTAVCCGAPFLLYKSTVRLRCVDSVS